MRAGRGTEQEDSWLARAGLRRLASQVFFQIFFQIYSPFANSLDFTGAGLHRLAGQFGPRMKPNYLLNQFQMYLIFANFQDFTLTLEAMQTFGLSIK